MKKIVNVKELKPYVKATLMENMGGVFTGLIPGEMSLFIASEIGEDIEIMKKSNLTVDERKNIVYRNFVPEIKNTLASEGRIAITRNLSRNFVAIYEIID